MGDSKQEYAVQNLLKTQSISAGKRKFISLILKIMGQRTLGEMILPLTGAKREAEYQSLVNIRQAYRELICKDLDVKGIQAILCPTFPTPALLHGGSKNLSYEVAYNSLINYLGFASGAFSYTVVRENEEVLQPNVIIKTSCKKQLWRRN